MRLAGLLISATLSLSLGSAAGAGRAIADEERPPAPLKVGVVDVVRVLERYERAKALELELNALKEKLMQELEETRARVRASTSEKEKVSETAWFEHRKKRMEETLREAMRESNRKLSEDIDEAIRQYGAGGGFDMIFRLPATAFEPRGSDDAGTKLVFFKQTLDVTDAIVASLNEKYRREAK